MIKGQFFDKTGTKLANFGRKNPYFVGKLVHCKGMIYYGNSLHCKGPILEEKFWAKRMVVLLWSLGVQGWKSHKYGTCWLLKGSSIYGGLSWSENVFRLNRTTFMAFWWNWTKLSVAYCKTEVRSCCQKSFWNLEKWLVHR